MSYIRYGSVFRYVVGKSEDYIFLNDDGYIEDYCGIKNDTLVEFITKLLTEAGCDDKAFIDYLIKHLAEKLDVKMRKKPLTNEQSIEMLLKEHNKFLKSHKKLKRYF